MADSRAFARSHGPFPAVAGAVLAVPIGEGQVVQIVSGAQPGLLLSWQDPAGSDFILSGAVEADRPDVAIAAAVDSVWLVWPPVLRSTDPVTLRSWSTPPSFVPPPWDRAGREEVEHLAEGENVTVPGVDVGLVIFDSEDAQRTDGTIELRRWSSVTLFLAFHIEDTITNLDIDVVLEIQTGGTWWWAYSAPATRNQVWQSGPGAQAGGLRRIMSATWPIPFARWRVRLNNTDPFNAKADFHLYRSTSTFARQHV